MSSSQHVPSSNGHFKSRNGSSRNGHTRNTSINTQTSTRSSASNTILQNSAVQDSVAEDSMIPDSVLKNSMLTAPVRRATAGDIAVLLGAELVGDAQTLITGVAGIESARPGAILFVETQALLQAAFASSAAAIIAPEHVGKEVRDAWKTADGQFTKPTLLTKNPRLAFAKVMEYFQPKPQRVAGVHPSAIVEKDAYIGDNVTIGANCYVGHQARIGDNCVLYPHVFVGDGAHMSDDCTLFASVVVEHQVHIGKRVLVHAGSVLGSDGFGYVIDGGKHRKVPQMGTVIIEDDVEIGANVCIDRATIGATRIGEGTKIDNLVHVAHNVQIGKNCILCGQVGISGSVVVEDGVMMAGQAGLADHVKVGKGAILGAKAGIMADVAAGDFVMGSPAISTREFMKREASSRKLSDSLRTLRTLEKQVLALQHEVESMKSQTSEV